MEMKAAVQVVEHQQDGGSPSARELVTVGDVRAGDLVVSGTKPCRGLTLLFQPSASAYHVCNLSTGEHVSLPPCPRPRTRRVEPHRPHVLSSAGLGFDPAADEHKVVRLYEDWALQQHCEVFGLRSGGWRRCAGAVPVHAARGLDGWPPVFVDGCFYWYVNSNLHSAGQATTPEPILSFSVGAEQFEWVRPPEERAHSIFRLVDLDGSLCAVVDARLTAELFELWTRTAGSGPSPPSWSLSLRISLVTLPQPARDDLGRGIRMLPLGSSGGKILLATSRHEVYAYDRESSSVDRVFSMKDFVDAPREAQILLNVALHEESVTGVRHRSRAGDGGRLKMKLGSSTIARREGAGTGRRNDFDVTPQLIQMVLSGVMDQYYKIINNNM